MPKPLFAKLVVLCAISFFCVLFGGAYALYSKDQIFLFMSILLGICCIFRFIILYFTIRKQAYQIFEGICIKKEKLPLTGSQKFFFVDVEGKEFPFIFEKRTRILKGHHYKLYLHKPKHDTIATDALPCVLLGFEEIPCSSCKTSNRM